MEEMVEAAGRGGFESRKGVEVSNKKERRSKANGSFHSRPGTLDFSVFESNRFASSGITSMLGASAAESGRKRSP